MKKSRICELYVKESRLNRGYSLQNVAEDLGFSKSHLSNLETGKATIKPEEFSAFLKRYNISFDFDESCFHDTYMRCLDLENAFIDMDFERLSLLAEETIRHLEKRKKLSDSYDFFQLKFMEFQLGAIAQYHKTDMESLFPVLLRNTEALPEDCRQIFFDCLGIFYMKQGSFQKASLYLDQGLSSGSSSSLPAMHSLLQYHRLVCSVYTGTSLQNYRNAQNLKNQFYRLHKYRRAICINSLEILILTGFREFEEAASIYLPLLSSSSYTDNLPGFLKLQILESAIWNELFWGHPQQAWEYFQAALKTACAHNLSFHSLFLGLFCLMGLHKEEQAQEFIELHKRIINDEENILWFAFFENFLKDRDKGFVKTSRKLEARLKKSCQSYPLLILYQTELEFYTRTHNKDGILAAQKHIIELYRRKPKFALYRDFS